MTDPQYVVLVPVKPPARGKSRLRRPRRRRPARLAAAFALDTVRAPAWPPTAVGAGARRHRRRAASPPTLARARLRGDPRRRHRRPQRDPAPGRRRGATPLARTWPPVALCADLPALRPDDLDAALAPVPAPARRRSSPTPPGSAPRCTPRRTTRFDPRFGPGSRDGAPRRRRASRSRATWPRCAATSTTSTTCEAARGARARAAHRGRGAAPPRTHDGRRLRRRRRPSTLGGRRPPSRGRRRGLLGRAFFGRCLLGRRPSWRRAFLAGGLLGRRVFLAAVFAVAFLAGAFLAGGLLGRRLLRGAFAVVFLAVAFLAGAAFFAVRLLRRRPSWPGAFFAGGLLGGAFLAGAFLAVAFFAAAVAFLAAGGAAASVSFGSFLAPETTFFRSGAGGELRHRRLLGLDPRAGLRVADPAGLADALLERAEAGDRDLLALGDLAGDRVEHGLQRVRRRLAVPLVTRGQRVDEL